jgi:hypothetical protein
MMFPNYQAMAVIGICIAPVIVGGLLFRIVRSTRPVVRIPTRIFSVLLCVCGVCLISLWGFMNFYFTSTRHSSAIYSPDHQDAIRVETWDAGAVGGGTNVVLYSHFGLVTKAIFSGDYAQVDKNSVRWLSNSQVVIEYDKSYEIANPFCEGSRSVSVKCVAVAFTYPRTLVDFRTPRQKVTPHPVTTFETKTLPLRY